MRHQYESPKGTIFAPPSNGTPTSSAAAKSVAPSTHTLRVELLTWLSGQAYGATDEEMQHGVPMAPNTQRPRRGELVSLGCVRDSGRTRPTQAGRQAVVWEYVKPVLEVAG